MVHERAGKKELFKKQHSSDVSSAMLGRIQNNKTLNYTALSLFQTADTVCPEGTEYKQHKLQQKLQAAGHSVKPAETLVNAAMCFFYGLLMFVSAQTSPEMSVIYTELEQCEQVR